MTLTVRGTRAQAERAFEVHIRDYEAGGRRFFANDTDPAVPRGLAADIQAVAGLSSAEPYASISFNELGAVLANVARTIGALLVPLLLTAARTVGTEVAMGCAQAPKACLIIAFNAVFIIDLRHYPE
jgi:Pro-kumamolisin, activation domain